MNNEQLIEMLSNPFQLQWRAHGIGFIKAYLDEEKRRRINIYSTPIIIPGISLHHDHPWDFTSTVRAGCLTNRRYVITDPEDEGAACFQEGVLNCADFKGITPTRLVWLHGAGYEKHGPGVTYRQEAHEIHATTATDGTVTILERSEPTGDGTARIYWPYKEEAAHLKDKGWTDATRPLTAEEIERACLSAIRELKEVQ